MKILNHMASANEQLALLLERQRKSHRLLKQINQRIDALDAQLSSIDARVYDNAERIVDLTDGVQSHLKQGTGSSNSSHSAAFVPPPPPPVPLRASRDDCCLPVAPRLLSRDGVFRGGCMGQTVAALRHCYGWTLSGSMQSGAARHEDASFSNKTNQNLNDCELGQINNRAMTGDKTE